MNLRQHKRRAVAGMARRRAALYRRGPYASRLSGPPADFYPRLKWTTHPWDAKTRAGGYPRHLADHFGYRPGSW